MDDTPSKKMFTEEQRTFSPSCIRLARPRDLAIEVLKEDKNWTVKKIDDAVNREVEKTYHIKTQTPVYKGCFTAWVYGAGQVNF